MLIPFKKFCELYGIGKTKAYELLKSGSIEGRKVGTSTLICAESAQRWAASLPKFEPRTGLRDHADAG